MGGSHTWKSVIAGSLSAANRRMAEPMRPVHPTISPAYNSPSVATSSACTIITREVLTQDLRRGGDKNLMVP